MEIPEESEGGEVGDVRWNGNERCRRWRRMRGIRNGEYKVLRRKYKDRKMKGAENIKVRKADKADQKNVWWK